MPLFKTKEPSSSHKWKLSKREFGQYRRKYKFDYTYEDFLKHLDSLFEYYLNDMGLSINNNGSPVKKELTKYMWAPLGITFEKEPLYVWMYQRGGGIFCCLTVGTKYEFDKEIVKFSKI